LFLRSKLIDLGSFEVRGVGCEAGAF